MEYSLIKNLTEPIRKKAKRLGWAYSSRFGDPENANWGQIVRYVYYFRRDKHEMFIELDEEKGIIKIGVTDEAIDHHGGELSYDIKSYYLADPKFMEKIMGGLK